MLASLVLAILPLATLQAPAANHLERPVVMGASLSAGFNAERPFVAALDASLRAAHQPPLDLGDIMFFLNPLGTGSDQVEAALDAEPSLVVAIDFLFWFGYGTLDANGGPIESETERLELLERGLALLEELECPLVIGDFPDMSAAIGKMLLAEQVPEKATLPLLSKRVREWAAEREHTLVLPLAELVTRLSSKEEIRIGRHVFPAGSQLLQPDELHPTLPGLAAMAQLVCDELVKAGLAREEDFELELDALMAKLRRGVELPVPTGTPR